MAGALKEKIEVASKKMLSLKEMNIPTKNLTGSTEYMKKLELLVMR